MRNLKGALPSTGLASQYGVLAGLRVKLSNAYTQNVITKTLTGGTTRSVSLSLSGVPAGTSYSIAGTNCPPTCNSTITFTVTPSTPAGTYPITVTGSPLLGKTTLFNLIVSGASFSASCSASPSTALIGETVTWTANPAGGTAPFTYAWSGTNIPTPPPSTNPYRRSYSTVGQKSAQVTITDADDVESTCPSGTVQINFNPKFEEF